ncbi:hypothetical protein BDEG_24019 [Batrachochytrium dendrobatidis JEL423]|uniref:DNA-directed RNA polymerase III subunit n=1 Tax=Batrachochytrium dendrobatidis (strain JEL423) TaxID=403673 RepID=A0A177WKQ4_BATDL|nr:hypothetical protein BDEG_24019 [Batrachochytrium dendrobatidis JEL423]
MSRGAPGGRGGGGWRGGRGGGRGGGNMGMGLDIPEGLVITYQEIPLYPAFDLPPFKEPTELENQMFDIYSKFIETMKSSPFFLEKPVVKKDLERYSDKYTAAKPISRMLHRTATDLTFFPEELHSVKDTTKKMAMPKLVSKDLDLKHLETLELAEAAQSKKEGGDAIGVNEDETLPEDEEYDEDIEEDDNDYLIDYYEDDLDVLGGDGSEGGDYDY